MLDKEKIIELIKDFVAHSEANDLRMGHPERIFDSPLVGFSNGADILYDLYRQHIGPFYRKPSDFLRGLYPELAIEDKDVTVISWILPSSARTRQEQAAQTKHPSERWVRTRFFGEEFNNLVRAHLTDVLINNGIAAVAPILSHLWSKSNEGAFAPCSNWSERHAAYAAGLGTFGLCDGLITPVGKAVRVGSVVAKCVLSPDLNRQDDHHAGCLYFSHDSCGKCINRCPIEAISLQGHDKQKCMQYTEHSMNAYIKKRYNINTYACGLCQCGIPCMDHIPSPEEG